MIENIENKAINIYIDNNEKEVILPRDIKNKIKDFWINAKNKNKNLWNGEIICVSSYEHKDKEIIIIYKKTNYAHYLYDERKTLPEEYACHSLSAGALLETYDNYYVLGELSEYTSFPHCIQPCGGSVEEIDLKNNSIFRTIIREAKEELDIDLENTNEVISNNIKYINIPNKNAQTYMIFTKTKLKFSKLELEQHYKKYLKKLKNNYKKIEFNQLHFIRKDNIREQFELLNNPKREFLLELLENDCKNK